MGESDSTEPTSTSSEPNASAIPSRGPGKEVAFQKAGSNGAEVWVSDLNQRTPYQVEAG